MRLEYFEMIDTVEALDLSAGTIRAVSHLPKSSTVFDGHFPGFPILPGVMMLEMINHAAGYLIFRRGEQRRFVFLGGVKRAKFRRFVAPGKRVEIAAGITHDGSGFAVAEGTLTVDGAVAADAEITMIITDFPNPDFAAAFKQRFGMIPVSSPAGAP
jgi:3-hydroxyacyl-[acyl-carrier-protein] dehydratase